MGQASAEESIGAANPALTFPMGSLPLVGREDKEQSQEKRPRKETEKEGWCLNKEEGAFVVENTTYITFKAWNLLTSRGITCSMSFLTGTFMEESNPLQKHFVR